MDIKYSDSNPEGKRRFDFDRFSERMFSGKKHQEIFKKIWQTLKSQPDESWNVHSLCDNLGLTYSTVHDVVGRLIEEGVIVKELGFLRLTNRFSTTLRFYAERYEKFYKQAPQKEKEYLDD